MKNLERKDIRDLGWEYIGSSIDDWFKLVGRFDMGNWEANKIEMHVGINYLKDNRVIIEAYDVKGGEPTPIFQGKLNYKEELLVLMKQLGILNTVK